MQTSLEAGKQSDFDADTGMAYMQQRYYDPVAGRFLSIDPVTTDANTGSSFNRYVYANNSPYKYIDPDGRAAISGEACLGICLGLTVGYSVKSGELAVTGNYGSGLGGGVSLDLRPNENGRANASDTSQGNGAVVNSYAKAGIEGSTGPLTIGAGAKGVAGMDVSTKQDFASQSEEYGFPKARDQVRLEPRLLQAPGSKLLVMSMLKIWRKASFQARKILLGRLIKNSRSRRFANLRRDIDRANNS